MTRNLLMTVAATTLVSACGNNNGSNDGGTDAGQTCTFGDASYATNCTYDPGFNSQYPNTPNTIGVTYSGETLGVDGLPYIPNLGNDPVFVDGWSVAIIESLVVVGDIRLDPGATGSAIWQNVTSGPIASQTPVVLRKGPYVMDAHKVGSYGVGKDGIEQASSLFVIPGLDNGQAFDPSVLYAFSYQTVPASWPVTNVNLDPNELPDYQLMVQHGWDKLIKGLATHTLTSPEGQGGGQPTPGAYPDSAIQAKFAAMPQSVYFAFGYDDHTQMYNCVNPDNAVDGSSTCSSDSIHCLAARGVQTNPSTQYAAQITLHQDHIFWDKLEFEGEPLRFDPIAAWAPGNTTEDNPFWINNLTGQQLATTFADGSPLPDRGPYMTGNNLPFVSDQTSAPIGGGQGQVIMNTNGATSVPPPGSTTPYPDFMEFSVQSQTHLNAQGICYIIGQHSADPFFVPNVATVSYGDPECATPAGCGGSTTTTGGTSGTTGTTTSSTSGTTGATTGSTGTTGTASGTNGTTTSGTSGTTGAATSSSSGTTG